VVSGFGSEFQNLMGFDFLPLAHTIMHLSAKKLFAFGEKDVGCERAFEAAVGGLFSLGFL